VRIDIFYDGSIYWNDERIDSVAALTPRFENVARQANPPQVNVVPEKRTHYERVVRVLAAAQRAHVVNMSVAPVADPGTL
jgi:biopolymer transport protein ExbD